MTRLRAAAVTFALVLVAVPATAHRQSVVRDSPPDGIPIAGLTHGQMAVIAGHRTAILKLAERQQPTDRVMRRLQGFVAIQFSTCGWGLAHGSIADEDSPFSECTHAYLAGTQALLMHLADMPGDRTDVWALMEQVQREMVLNGAALQMCRFSDEGFNTAEVVYPDWPSVARSVAAPLAGTGLSLACGLIWMSVRRRRMPGESHGSSHRKPLLDRRA